MKVNPIHPTQARRIPSRSTRRQRDQNLSAVLMVVGFGLLAVVALLINQSPANANLQPARLNQPLPDLILNDLDGNPVRLRDYQGQVVLINAWATWCPPCRAEMPLLAAYANKYQDQGFALLAINAGESADTVRSFIHSNGYQISVLLDPNAETIDQLGIHSFPTSIVIDRQGVVQVIHIGVYTLEGLEQDLNPLVQH